MPPSNKPKLIKTDAGMSLKCGMPSCHNIFPSPPCEHLNAWIEAGHDASGITASSSVAVYALHGDSDLVPALNWVGWTTVEVGTELRGGFRQIKLSHSRANSAKLTSDLGLLSPWDGRYTLAQQVMDAVLARLDPNDKFNATGKLETQCHSTLHSFKHQKSKLDWEKSSSSSRLKMMFCLALEAACIPCLLDAYGDVSNNFGVDENSIQYGKSAGHIADADPLPPFDSAVATKIKSVVTASLTPSPIGMTFRGGVIAGIAREHHRGIITDIHTKITIYFTDGREIDLEVPEQIEEFREALRLQGYTGDHE